MENDNITIGVICSNFTHPNITTFCFPNTSELVLWMTFRYSQIKVQECDMGSYVDVYPKLYSFEYKLTYIHQVKRDFISHMTFLVIYLKKPFKMCLLYDL